MCVPKSSVRITGINRVGETLITKINEQPNSTCAVESWDKCDSNNNYVLQTY